MRIQQKQCMLKAYDIPKRRGSSFLDHYKDPKSYKEPSPLDELENNDYAIEIKDVSVTDNMKLVKPLKVTYKNDISVEGKCFRVMLLGKKGVGKTSIFGKYTTDTFDPDVLSSTGVDIATVERKTKNGETVYIEVNDSAGQDQYLSITRQFYQRANGFIIVIDATDPLSILVAQGFFIDVQRHAHQDPPVTICVNKSDLVVGEELRTIIESQAFKIGGNCIYTSAMTGDNIDELFSDITEKIIEHQKKIDTTTQDDNKIKVINEFVEKMEKKGHTQKKKNNCC